MAIRSIPIRIIHLAAELDHIELAATHTDAIKDNHQQAKGYQESPEGRAMIAMVV
jgi:hypothetical protein